MLRIALSVNDSFSRIGLDSLRAAGVEFSIPDNAYPIARSQKFPAEIFFLSYSEILSSVASGIVDVGIVGEHHLVEKSLPMEVVYRFATERFNLSLVIPKEAKYKGIEWFTGKKIATRFPEALSVFLKSKGIRAQIIHAENHLFFTPELGLSDGFFDIVTSESDLNEHQLRESEVMMTSSPIIVTTSNLSAPKKMILDELLARIEARQCTVGKKVVAMNVPIEHREEVLSLIKTENKPYVLKMEDESRCLIQALLEENRLWDMTDHLKQLGVESIAVLPIDKYIP